MPGRLMRSVCPCRSAPPGLVFVSASAPCSAGFPCALGTIPAGAPPQTVAVTFHVTPAYTTPDPIVNSATLSSVTADPASGNNTATASTPITAPVTDLGISKTNGVTTVVPGSTTTYTITVTNAGPSAAVGATVTDFFPAALSGVTWTCVGTAGGVCSAASGSGNINLPIDIAVGGTVTFTASGTVKADALGVLVNVAAVQPPPGASDPSSANNTDSDTLTPQADLSIVKTGPPSIVPGDVITYTIAATNHGPSNADTVIVSDRRRPG